MSDDLPDDVPEVGDFLSDELVFGLLGGLSLLVEIALTGVVVALERALFKVVALFARFELVKGVFLDVTGDHV